MSVIGKMSDAVFDHRPVDRFMLWAWGPYKYPRWQRRAYILLWPLLMPLRWIALGAVVIGLMLLFFVIGGICEIVIGLFDEARTFRRYIQKQWN